MSRRTVLALVFAPAMAVGCTLVAGVDFDAAHQATSPGDAAPGVDVARADVVVTPTDSGMDVTIADASPPVDATDPCDQDGDGYLSLACDGSDCDDNDSRTHPAATYQTVVPTAPRFGDWNCDGVVELRYKQDAACDAPVATTCGLRDGFVGAPGCGGSGTFVNCALSGGNCVVLTSTTKTQGCR